MKNDNLIVRKIEGKGKKIRRYKRKVIEKIIHWVRNYPQIKKENMRNSASDTQRIIVVGRNYCSNLTMARALGDAGYEVEVLRVFQYKPRVMSLAKYIRVDAYSRHIKAYHTCIARGKSKRIIKKLINIADKDNKMLLIPVDDLVADVVDVYMEKLKPYYIMSNVNGIPGELSRMMSKEVQKDLAIKAGLPMVNGCVIRTVNGNFEIPSTVTYPCFIKPNISKNAFKTHMQKLESEEELRAWIGKLASKKDIEMLVEDYINIDKEYALLGVSTREKTIAPGYLALEKMGHDARRGVAMLGRVVSCEEDKALIDSIIKFVSSLNFEGLFDVDLVRTKEGKLLFTELNLRFGGSGYAVTKSGVNLPAMFANYMLKGEPINSNCTVTKVGKMFINEKVMLDEYLYDYISLDEMKEMMRNTDIHFVKDEHDGGAFKHFKQFYDLAVCLKLLLRLKLKIYKK